MDKLSHILKNENAATYFINSARTTIYTPRTMTKFVETFEKNEATKMETERISPNVDTITVWIRGYGTNSYMIKTDRDNLVGEVPQN